MRTKKVRYTCYMKYDFLSTKRDIFIFQCIYRTREEAEESIKNTIENEMSKDYGWRNMRAYIKKVTF